MDLRTLGHRAPALWLLLPLAAGLAAGEAGWAPDTPGWLLAGAAAALAAAWAGPRVWPAGFAVGVTLAGAAYYGLVRHRLPAWDALPPREARLTVRVERLFPADPGASRRSGLGRITGTDPHLRELAGHRIYFTVAADRTHPPRREAVLAMTGVLTTLPRHAAAGSFEGYLAGAGINFRLARGRVDAVVAAPPAYPRFCDDVLARFDAILRHGLDHRPAPGGVYRAMMLGQKQELSDEQDALFLQSGTLHLFAISGLHISAIAIGFQVLLAFTRLPRWAQFAAATAALWLYVDATGRAPSAVRAFVMMGLFNAARLLRVPGNSLSALAVSAVVVLLLDPLQLFGAGFQMSYGIVAALLLLGLPLAEAWKRRLGWFAALPEAAKGPGHRGAAHAWESVLTAVAFGLAATLISTASSLTFFQLITPASFAANLVLIPLSILVILAGLGSLIAGLIGLLPLSVVFNHAAVLVLTVMDSLLRLVVALPGAHRAASFRADWLGSSVVAGLLALMAYGYARRWAPEHGGYWPPFVLLALVLAFGTVYVG